MIGRCCSFFLRLEDQCFYCTALSSACEKERPPPSPGTSRCGSAGSCPPRRSSPTLRSCKKTGQEAPAVLGQMHVFT